MRQLVLLPVLLLASCSRPHQAPVEPPQAQTVSASDLSGSVVLNVVQDEIGKWQGTSIISSYTDGTRACGTILQGSELRVFYATTSAPLGVFTPGKNPTADACAKLAAPKATNAG